ncbi:50S ribosomal protein L19 [Candidatus Peregrinibacteria bacterium]|jgi:large subunit ribosomal protein L19|nr:50S ribosomal protein L19 [Candidatus Peregrinibacteria bacterium]MBT7483141.1 50S ribosomal protein L19 [Candidatus Peregrinibacteria bacterium]MBT7703839.1 50S ribosomal protein L19 [Candidatus Peregrinibacteria bacterium]
MNQALLSHVQQKSLKKRVPPIRTGNTVRVHQKIVESTKDGSKERIQLFEGLVIATNSGAGTDKTFTVRKIASGVGVEKIFPVHSSNIAKIEVIRNSKVRRSKLYFMRNRTGKSARLKEAKLMGYDFPEEEEEASEEAIQEAVEAVKEAEEAEKAEQSGGDDSEADAPAEEVKEEAKAEEVAEEPPAEEAKAEEEKKDEE